MKIPRNAFVIVFVAMAIAFFFLVDSGEQAIAPTEELPVIADVETVSEVIPQASEAEEIGFVGEHIERFAVDIVVARDGTMRVTETIVYDFADQYRHGIYRTIPNAPPPGVDGPLRFAHPVVTNEQGTLYEFDVSGHFQSTDLFTQVYTLVFGSSLLLSDDDIGIFSLKIGDPDETITGEHTYVIAYEVENAVGRFDDRSEIYWNATGNEWEVPIEYASARVTIPGHQVDALILTSYCGPSGDDMACSDPVVLYDAARDVTIVAFEAEAALLEREGMTVAVGFPLGVVSAPEADAPVTLPSWLVFLGNIWFYPIPVLLTLYFFRERIRYARDRHAFYKERPIVVEYDTDLSPLEAAHIFLGTAKNKHLSAEIVWLAVHGYLVIKKEEDGYRFEGTGKNANALTEYDQMLLAGIAGKHQSELKDTFYTTASSIISSVSLALHARGAVQLDASKMASFVSHSHGMQVLLLFLALNPGIFIWMLAGWKVGVIFSGTCLLSAVAGFVLPGRLLLSKSGLEAERHLRGLRRYIDLAEEERIKFHSVPEKSPETFERLLPYAMIFGLEKKWAAEFRDIYTVPPSWYTGDNNLSSFSTGAFVGSLSSFSSSTASAMSAPAGSSGSGSGSSGGGSSGGGGGGGGGGSW